MFVQPHDGGSTLFRNVELLTKYRGITPQKTVHFIVTAMGTSNIKKKSPEKDNRPLQWNLKFLGARVVVYGGGMGQT
jgi:hypothetical protein